MLLVGVVVVMVAIAVFSFIPRKFERCDEFAELWLQMVESLNGNGRNKILLTGERTTRVLQQLVGLHGGPRLSRRG
jgi:hypothetical protein